MGLHKYYYKHGAKKIAARIAGERLLAGCQLQLEVKKNAFSRNYFPISRGFSRVHKVFYHVLIAHYTYYTSVKPEEKDKN